MSSYFLWWMMEKAKEILERMSSSVNASYPANVLGYPQRLHDLLFGSASLHCLLGQRPGSFDGPM